MSRHRDQAVPKELLIQAKYEIEKCNEYAKGENTEDLGRYWQFANYITSNCNHG
jgi:hypothetical protein